MMDEAAFRVLYEQTAPRLRAYLYTALRDADLADDCLQEAFYRLLRAEPQDANIHQLRAYLYKTAVTLVADHRRRVATERTWQERWRGRESSFPTRDLALDMQTLFARLAPKQQALLWLAYVEELSHREIAASLGMQEMSVRVVLYRARKRLAAILEDHGLGPRNSP